jgi:uncharacterized lipoprotein YehR (DUF1307 family)
MRRTNRLVAFLVAFALVGALAACGGSESQGFREDTSDTSTPDDAADADDDVLPDQVADGDDVFVPRA